MLVPYYSQWETRSLNASILSGEVLAREDPSWQRSGANDSLDYEYWSWQSCGLACLKMLLEAEGRSSPPIVSLAKEAARQGAFIPTPTGLKGLIYRPFVDWVQRTFDVKLSIFEHSDVSWLQSALREGAMAIASVHPEIRDARASEMLPTSRGGHLVLLYALRQDVFVLHNPSGTTPANQEGFEIDSDRFMDYFSGRGMLYQNVPPQLRRELSRITSVSPTTQGLGSSKRPDTHPYKEV